MDVTAEPLSGIFVASLGMEKVPQDWKRSIILILEKWKRVMSTQLGSMSSTFIPGKVLEADIKCMVSEHAKKEVVLTQSFINTNSC